VYGDDCQVARPCIEHQRDNVGLNSSLPLGLAASSLSCQSCGCAASSCETCRTPADCSNCASCCCNDIHQSWRETRTGAGITIEYFSTAWMTVEVIGSVWSGLVAGSFSLLAFGGDSLVELLSGITVLSFLRRPPAGPRSDGGRTERLTNALLFSLIPVITLVAIFSYLTGLKPEASPLGIAIAFGAVVIMPYLWLGKRRIGRETRSSILLMDAVASLTCILMSVALLVGLLVEYFLGLWWVDYLATAIILAFVSREAVGSFRERHG
jgi:divalent metal cation (Fe/Co/Zn/Cd) transporter